MDVRIGTLTSRVNVADPGASEELVERIVAIVLSRLRDEHDSREIAKREQEIRRHMSDPARF